MKKRILAGTAAVLLAVLLVVLLGLYAAGPAISCGVELPEDCLEAVESQAGGLYSKALPLIPVRVSVTGYEEETVFYTIYYFPFGTVEMSYRAGEGYNMEKPLTRL